MAESQDQGRRIGSLFYDELERRLRDGAQACTAAELELIRKVLDSNAITLSQVKAGDFGKLAQSVAEEFPDFGDEDEARKYAQ